MKGIKLDFFEERLEVKRPRTKDRFLPNQYENRVCKYFSFEVTKGFNLGLSSKS